MAFTIGQKVTFSPLGVGKNERAVIIERGIDYSKGHINTPNAKGNFDYLISIERSGKTEHVFCKENELK